MPNCKIGIFFVAQRIFFVRTFIAVEPAVFFLAACFDLGIVNGIDFRFLGLIFDIFP